MQRDYTSLFESKIPQGKDNAISAQELAEKTGFKTKRGMRQALHKARRQGLIVASRTDAVGGYFIPTTKQEIKEFRDSMKRRGVSVLAVTTPSSRKLNETDGQLSVDDLEESED